MRRLATAVLTLTLASPLAVAQEAQASAPPRGDHATHDRASGADARAGFSGLKITRVARGLSQPWDVAPLPRGKGYLITERDTHRLLLASKGRLRRIGFPSAWVWSSSETGLMDVAVDPAFTRNRLFYTCQGGTESNGRHDVRVVAWRLNSAQTRARRVRTLLAGIGTSSGRHGGCRLLIPRYGALLVGTGDAAVGTNAQNLGVLNGKVLRLNRSTGAPWPQNPWIRSANPRTRYLLTYGHRNVQGLAQRSDGTIWSVEHGPARDDEVNLLVSGGNYGWNPVPGYNESVPMTDQSLPGTQVAARWSSGAPTLATSGAAWVSGPHWGTYNGTLAVAALKAGRVLFMRYDARGRLVSTATPTALRRYGRLRSVTRDHNGDLLITTANGRADSVLRVHAR